MNKAVDPLALTKELIAFNTINPPGQEQDCARFIGELLDKLGFQVTYHDFANGRTNVIARRGGRDLPLCFTGHIDTVPLGTRKWRFDPFGGETADGKIYGRGSADMKAGIAAFIAAAVNAPIDWNDHAGVLFVITAGEETGSEGAKYLTESADLLGNSGAVVVAEPTSNYPLIGHKGALWLQAATIGVTAHGSTPSQGVNAIYKAANVVSKLARFEFPGEAHPNLGSPTLNVGTIRGGLNMNSVPDSTRIGIDIRTVPNINHRELQEQISQYLAPDLDSIKALIDLDGIWTDPENEWVQRVFDIVGEAVGERPEPHSARYFTDASALTPYFKAPTIVLGPGDAEMAHQTDEYCEVSRILQATEYYSAILSDWRNIK